MKEKRNVLRDRIRSAKLWLNRAEASFDKENNVQGEINLLLAQAELKHLQEKKCSLLRRNKQIIALLTATFIAVSFWGLRKGYLVRFSKTLPAVQTDEQASVINNLKTVPMQSNKSADVQQAENTLSISKAEKTFDRQTKVENTQVIFSENEMRDFVRTAGQVLRGNSQ